MSQTNFYGELAEILNSGQSQCVILSGNVYDLFGHESGDNDEVSEYVPLIPLLCEKSKTERVIRIVYELNGPIRILDNPEKLKEAWITWRSGLDAVTLQLKGLQSRGPSDFDRLSQEFDGLMTEAIGNPTLALETMRQLTICSRTNLSSNLLILVGGSRHGAAVGKRRRRGSKRQTTSSY